MDTIETERLTLRMWKPEDFEDYAALVADPEVMRFLAADGQPLPRFEAWRSFCTNVGHWHVRGFGLFAVVERTTGELVGRIGPWQPEQWPDFEVGWSLRSKYWGRGYATEAVNRCLDLCFNELQQSHVSSFIDPENARSIRLAERVGERLEGEATLPHMPDKKLLQYGLTRADWQRRPQRAISYHV